MFCNGQYLEIIKASNNCLVTVVVTVQEKIIKIKEKKVSTNKWLNLEDWIALYKILEKAILRNFQTEESLQNFKKCKWKKSTRQLEVTYTFEPSESVKDIMSLPTIRVNVSPAKRKLTKSELPKIVTKKKEIWNQITENMVRKNSNYMHEKDNYNLSKESENNDLVMKVSIDAKNDKIKRCFPIESTENDILEEYVPNAPISKKLCANLNYVQNNKNTLKQIQVLSNEYSPMISENKSIMEEVQYIPNSMNSLDISYETYEPSATTVLYHPEEYIPNSKGVKAFIEEYHPDFTNKTMKFDNSYVPSRLQITNENSKKLFERHTKITIRKTYIKTKRNIKS